MAGTISGYADLNTVQTPANGVIASPAWGLQVGANFVSIYDYLVQIQTTKAVLTGYQGGSNFTVASSSGATVENLTVVTDPGSNCNAANGSFTCPVAGTYIVESSVFFQSSAGGSTDDLALYVNGTYFREIAAATSTSNVTANRAIIADFAADAVLTLQVKNNSGSATLTVSAVYFNVALHSYP